MIVVVDYKMGNVGSVLNILKKLGARAIASSDTGEIKSASKLILPGVGAFDAGMTCLNDAGLVDLLSHRVLQEGVPLLGICLGMQLLSRRSEEGNLPGLGWIEADTVRFKFEPNDATLKIPHMGWNVARPIDTFDLFHGMDEAARFYFVHSFYLKCDKREDVLACTQHGIEFASAVRHGKIFGTQFHPEKSHRQGTLVLKNFIERC